MTEVPYEEQIARDYVNGGEAERLRLERMEPYAIGDLYEHGKVWTPWPREEAERERAIARALLFGREHVAEHHGDFSELAVTNCGTCALNGRPWRKRGPDYGGWERVYVQAGAVIPDAWREAFAWWLTPEGEAENKSYADCLGRDVVTFGLRDPRGLVRVPWLGSLKAGAS